MNGHHPPVPSGKLYLPDADPDPYSSELDYSLDTIPRSADAAGHAASDRLSPDTEPVRESTKADAVPDGAGENPPFAMPGGSYAWPVRVGNFTLVDKVHQGRMSAVWRATDETGRICRAVKLVPLSLASNTDERSLARLVRVSTHPGLLTLVGHGIQDEWWYQVAEWTGGDTLQSQLQAHTPLEDAADLRAWMKQVASALEALHRAGFVHGDVKPSNVLVSGSHAVLIDLAGLRMGSTWAKQGGLTPAFASPEARKGAPSDPRDDVYSLAAMILRLLTGEAVDRKRDRQPAAAPPAGLSPSQWRILRETLETNRASRAESALGLVDALWPDMREPVSVPPQIPNEPDVPAALPARRSRPAARALKHGWGKAAMATIAVLMVDADTGQRGVPGSGGEGALVASGMVWRPLFPETQFVRMAALPVFRAPVVGDASGSRSRSLREPVATPVLSVREESVSAAPRAEAPRPASPSAPEILPVVVDRATTVAVRLDRPEPPRPPPIFERPEIPAELARPEVPAVPAGPEIPEVPTRPEVPDIPARPEIPVVSARPEVPATPVIPTLPDIPAVPARPEVPVVPTRPEVPAAPARPEVPVVPTRPEVPAAPARPEVPVAPARPEVPAAPVRPEAPVVPTLPDIPVIPALPDIPIVPTLPDLPALPVLPDLPVIPDRPDRPDKPGAPDRPNRPDRPERPERR